VKWSVEMKEEGVEKRREAGGEREWRTGVDPRRIK
jgi:hypothetical protein